MIKDVDYQYAKDHSVPYGFRIELISGPFAGFRCFFSNVRLEDGKIKFEYVPDELRDENDLIIIRPYSTDDPRLQEALKEVLKDINNTVADRLHA